MIKKYFFAFFVFLFLLVGCSNEEKHEIIEIGIVGETPSLFKENNIKFIMITKDLNSSIPIVFVQSDKAISAFIIPNHTYENTFENYAEDYFIGYYKGTTFGVALNGNTNEDLIKGYMSLFALLARLKQRNN